MCVCERTCVSACVCEHACVYVHCVFLITCLYLFCLLLYFYFLQPAKRTPIGVPLPGAASKSSVLYMCVVLSM